MINLFKNTSINQNLGHFYQFFFASILPLAVFIPLSLPILTHFIALIFLFELVTIRSLKKQIYKENIKTFCCINSFSLICFLSVLTSISPWLSFKGVVHLTYYINLGFLMYCGAQVTAYKTKILKGLWIGFVLGLIFGLIESCSQGSIIKFMYNPLIEMHKYNKFTSVLSLFIPFLVLISFKEIGIFSKFSKNSLKKYFIFEHLMKSLLCLISIYIVFNFNSDASKLTIIIDIALISFFLFYFISFKTVIFFTRILIYLCFLIPLLTNYTYNIPSVQKKIFQTIKKGSFYDRLSIWKYVQDLSLNKGPIPRTLPQQILGFGFNSSKLELLSSPSRTWSSPVKVLNSYELITMTSQAIPLHPHNFILQIWLELGYLGITLTFILLNIFLNYIFKIRSSYLYIVASIISFFNFMTIASIGYGIWQSWWLCTVILTITISKIFRNKTKIKIDPISKNYDYDYLKHFFQDKRILITGCGGSIGHELRRQVISFQPSHLSLLESSEHYLYQCFNDMRDRQLTFSWQTFLCDVSNLIPIKQIVDQEKLDIIFHAAALTYLSLAKKIQSITRRDCTSKITENKIAIKMINRMRHLCLPKALLSA